MSSFIYPFTLKDLSICDKLIEYHKNNTEYKKEGTVQKSKGKPEVDHEQKHSIDVTFQPYSQDPCIKEYCKEIQRGINEYVKEFEPLSMTSMSVNTGINIQHYPPGGGFKKWHFERMAASFPQVSRILVFMTYLNDVTDEGETEWVYQDIKIQPKKGLSVIWPSEFTHTHRGIPSKTQEKYISTGWINLI